MNCKKSSAQARINIVPPIGVIIPIGLKLILVNDMVESKYIEPEKKTTPNKVSQ